MNSTTKHEQLSFPQLFDFDAADVAANRTGKLSRRQKRQLYEQKTSCFVLGVVFMLATAFFGTLGLTLNGIGLQLAQDAQTGKTGIGWIMLIVCAALVLLLGYGLRSYWVLLDEIEDGQVVRIAGILEKFRFYNTYLIHVQRRYLLVSLTVFHHLEDQKMYEVFYTPRTRTLIAIVPIPQGKTL